MPIFTYNKHTIVLKKSESLTRLQPIDIIEGIKRIPLTNSPRINAGDSPTNAGAPAAFFLVKNICQRYLKQINKSIIIIN
ncbi:unnamed protein product [marine sediment metagenome]|uniref:Uncharacterized protein n=1 Tax=marine sediment metagenome TaxID=412755 RepID=X1BXU1_9ZZZZ